MNTGRVNAPELHSKFGWLNTDREYSLKELRGKFVLLDFWTFGCINCQHILPDLKRLEQEYPEELVVIGVHSAKFDAEKSSDTIRKAIQKFGIEHPVINDADFSIWRQYAINAWPTIVLIDPDGKVVGQRAGEGVYEVVKPNLDFMIKDFEDKLNREIIHFRKEEKEGNVLRFPTKILAHNDTVFVADSGNNRILQLDREGKMLETIGSGQEGFANGSFAEASFHEPQGMALAGNILYVADTRNHAIRKVDLVSKEVQTAAGSGKLGYYFGNEKWGVPVDPNSPWDLVIKENTLYIANAGNHQILQMNLKTEVVTRFAGTGSEALLNGTLHDAAFNQPSGLALSGDKLYIADAEASAVRCLDLRNGSVNTLLGKGLFDFGDMDGDADIALLQHLTGLTEKENCLFLADTYNGKIKILNLESKRVRTLTAGLFEPNDVEFVGRELWVSSTNSHELYRVDAETGEKSLIAVH
ncbi:thioredoxin-like domain-containing protein [Adhaeribacter soli]|uniref:Redoxin domain-containing protein n=1 Tax=Adhaeribacter soli TaxID=2607655 RepID=A0A5N1IR01_9BACT|nr:thioredoxin-like domain-containing protein [Adhaeribacter soli]KAA9331955.1 redoxin domain-containing protein [Adhaeribacter soli]